MDNRRVKRRLIILRTNFLQVVTGRHGALRRQEISLKKWRGDKKRWAVCHYSISARESLRSGYQ